MTDSGPDVREILSSESWEFLLERTILYAAGHINRWYWRGALGGVLPDGFDPKSLAAEVIAEFLHHSAQQGDLGHLPAANIQRDLERRVRKWSPYFMRQSVLSRRNFSYAPAPVTARDRQTP